MDKLISVNFDISYIMDIAKDKSNYAGFDKY